MTITRSLSGVLAALLLGCGAAFADNASAEPLAVRIDADKRFQTIEGWGTSMSGVWIEKTPYRDPRWRAAYRDLGLNMLRVPMVRWALIAPDGHHATPVELGPDIDRNIELMNFEDAEIVSDADVARWLRENALEPERVRIVGSLWSAPHWMKGPTGMSQDYVGDFKKTVGKHPTPWLTGDFADWQKKGTGDSIGGRLRTEDPHVLEQYGRYIATWVRGYEKYHGIPFYAISIQNESTFENPFDSMTLGHDAKGRQDPKQYAMALRAVRDAWKQFGLTTKIKGPHVAQIGPEPENPWSLASQAGMIDAVRAAGLTDFLDYYNSNYYMGVNEGAVKATAGYYLGTDAVPAAWGKAWGVNFRWGGVARDNKPVWFSEAGGEENHWLAGKNASPGNGAITIPLKIHNALVFANAVTYLYWQMSDHQEDESSHTLLGHDALDNPLKSEKYAAFKHFSRYVRPGAQRVEAIIDDPSREHDLPSYGGASPWDTRHALNVSAFLHDADRTATIVFVNMRETDHEVRIAVPKRPDVMRFQVFVTDGVRMFEPAADAEVEGGVVALTIPRYSAVTLFGQAARD